MTDDFSSHSEGEAVAGGARKPAEFTSLAARVAPVFRALRESFPELRTVQVDVSELEHPEPALDDLHAVIVFTLRRLQGLYHCAQPGVLTTADVVIGLVSEIERALDEIKNFTTDIELNIAIEQFTHAVGPAMTALMRAVGDDALAPLR